MKLVYQKNCAATDLAAPDFFCCGEVKQITDDCGSYLEAAPVPLARFGYRFQLESGRPHLLKLRYPDNCRRFMTVGDGTSYDASCAVVTGHAWEVSHQMQELRQIFWPRFDDFSLCFMTWGHDEPAAVADFEIYELADDELTELKLPSGGRRLGVQYEDPCGTQASEGAVNFEEWLDRVVTYLKHTGQNLLVYPLCWYHGPWFPNTAEPAQTFALTAATDRKQYLVWCDHPQDWPAQILRRCQTDNIDFMAEFTLLRLESLMKQMNLDQAQVAAGTPTVNNILDNNLIQSGTMDWTVVYHSSNYPEMLQSNDPFNTAAPRQMPFGEKSRVDGCPVGPVFNVLMPQVQTQILHFFEATCRQYGSFAAFRGITVTMWAPTLLWFGSLKSGYDDLTVQRFAQTYRLTLPGEPTDPRRFAKRARYLLKHHRQQWIGWRCREIAKFIKQIRDLMVLIRPDLTLSLTMWNEPFVPAVLPMHTLQSQYGRRANCDRLYREAGIDIALLAGEKNIEIVFQTEGGNRDRTPGNQTDKLEAFYMFRDFDYLDTSFWRKLKKMERPGVFVFNAWHEAWGKHLWFEPEKNDPNLTRYNQVYGQSADGMFRINSYYQPDGFWWDSQLRIAPATPPAPYYMEHFAHALAMADALKITAGGLYLDKVHTAELQAFARVYRRLPDRKFITVGRRTDPVAVRQLSDQGKCYVYCVNREPYAVKVKLNFVRPAEGYLLADGQKYQGQTLDLKAFELTALVIKNNRVRAFEHEIPPEIIQTITRKAKAALRLPKLPAKIRRDLQNSLDRGHFARVRHLLHSYPAAAASKE